MFDYKEDWRERTHRNSGNHPKTEGKVPKSGRKQNYNLNTIN